MFVSHDTPIRVTSRTRGLRCWRAHPERLRHQELARLAEGFTDVCVIQRSIHSTVKKQTVSMTAPLRDASKNRNNQSVVGRTWL
jgi:predicted ribonuclease YlaK